MKGIILAGGKGSRLGELTKGISKQLLPVYKQPMVYYPLKTLIDMGITEILIIVASHVQSDIFYEFLGSGGKFGVDITYIVQENPNGLAEAFIIGESFIGDDDVTLILGDNVFLSNYNMSAMPNNIFTYKVKDPSAYGVVKIDDDTGNILEMVEKPIDFVSNDAVVGLYVFTNTAVRLAKTLTPSKRGELEIVDLIMAMNLEEGIHPIEFDGVWFDCGTPDDLLECAEFVRALDKRTNHDIFLKEI
jgi:glucose-1-phosphate thymidylyltransferase